MPSDPDAVARVDPYPDLTWAWNGFWRLSNSRPQGMNGYLRIPLSEIDSYCRLQGFGREKREQFLLFVERLDEAFMKHVDKLREQQEQLAKTQQSQPKANVPGRRGRR